MRPLVQSIIFDFDYTLADSSRGIVDSVNFALARLGLPKANKAQICPLIGLSLPETLCRLCGEEARDCADEFVRLFIQRADEVMVDYTDIFGPVSSTVDQLRRQGISLGIVSTKFRHRIETILQRESLLHSFDTIVGGEDVSSHKPDPEGLLTAMKRLNTSPPHCLYVGDSTTDAQTAQRAGVAFVAVLSGVTARNDFKEFRVFRFLETLSELPSIVDIKKTRHGQGAPSCE
jgi:phosphoglycolate phosphatase